MFGWGEYPVAYNKKIHGPYDPSRYYGKPDTPFGEVKLGELGKWFSRRSKTPSAITGAISRAHWRWSDKYVSPKKGGIAPVIQFVFVGMTLFYLINYTKIVKHRNVKYHW